MRRIRLEQTYRNATGTFVPRGDYWEDDPALKGLGSYLVETRHAEVLSDTDDVMPQKEFLLKEREAVPGEQLPEIPLSEGGTPLEETPRIDDMSLAELKEEATRLGLQFGSKATKAELIALIGGSSVQEDDSDETA